MQPWWWRTVVSGYSIWCPYPPPPPPPKKNKNLEIELRFNYTLVIFTGFHTERGKVGARIPPSPSHNFPPIKILKLSMVLSQVLHTYLFIQAEVAKCIGGQSLPRSRGGGGGGREGGGRKQGHIDHTLSMRWYYLHTEDKTQGNCLQSHLPITGPQLMRPGTGWKCPVQLYSNVKNWITIKFYAKSSLQGLPPIKASMLSKDAPIPRYTQNLNKPTTAIKELTICFGCTSNGSFDATPSWVVRVTRNKAPSPSPSSSSLLPSKVDTSSCVVPLTGWGAIPSEEGGGRTSRESVLGCLVNRLAVEVWRGKGSPM